MWGRAPSSVQAEQSSAMLTTREAQKARGFFIATKEKQ
jgi:hypothetical protein